MGAEIRARGAREAAQKAAREADHAEAHAVVHPHGRLWRTRAAIAYDRAMPQRRSRLA
jgi:aromatic ring-opening dioxygenase LigB subunit